MRQTLLRSLHYRVLKGSVLNHMDENNSKTENILRAAEGIGSSGLSLLVGLGLWGLIAATFVLGAVFLFLNDGYIYNKENCIKIEKIDGKTYKVNSCKDTVIELKS